MTSPFSLLLPACLVVAAMPAQAGGDDAASASPSAALPITTTVTLSSQYVSRGMRQTWGRPALQAGIDYAHPSGWSLGTWTSTVSDRFIEGGRVEWDLYGGYAGTLGPLGVSLNLMHYRYPGARIGATGTKYDYTEVVPGLGYQSFYAKYYRTVSRDFFGITNARGTGYLDVGLNHDLGGGYVLNLHVGDGRVAGEGNAIWDWRDAKAGVTRTFDGGWSIAAAWTRAWGATDAYHRYTTGVPRGDGAVAYSNPAKDTFAASVARTF
ncbi:TorF family putative porin [Massilia alkalitolerans]|uniref:TorF family putative porin n=1 Tax=Massilia alkalitolerans TaxID=286638 RepID=UPI0004142BF8|nr:TorF family putative porin [Massilia alkalitolerans]